MSDSAETASFDAVPDPEAQPVTASAGASWPPDSSHSGAGAAAERPELLLAGAFVGGLALATILKRIAG